MNNEISLILDTDSYKMSHWLQYPPNTSYMFSYFESRGGKYDQTLFFGLQYYLKKYFSKPITVQQVDEANNFAQLHGEPFNYEGWMYIATELKGKLPVIIKAVEEGSVIPTKNALVTVESTDPKCFWIVSWIETILVRLWYPITVATQSYMVKQLLKEYLNKTSDDPEEDIKFKLHDFGSRGVSSQESAMIGGAAHLINFLGTDTIAGTWMANKYYDCDMAGYSIPASEHSTMTMWGREKEKDAYQNMLETYKDSFMFACVSDSYDIYNAAESIWGGELKKMVVEHEGFVVIRPDSGHPSTIVSDLLEILDLKFDHTMNSKGYKVLNDVRIIQGDGVNYDSIKEIVELSESMGYSITNLAFGMGGGLLQKLNRDTQKFAFKCSAAMVDNQMIDVYKDPVTDPGKKSKKGILDLIKKKDGTICTCRIDEKNSDDISLLNIVFKDGEIVGNTTFEEIRKRSECF